MDFITFSRQLGTNSTEISKKVADQLGYHFVDNQVIEKAAQDMGVLEDLVKVDEKAPSFFQRFFSHKPSINLDRLNSVIYELARRGNSVFLGRGGQILLKSFDCALHVRIIASRPRRILNLIERGYSEEAASKAIDHSDHERSAFMKFAFNVDWEDPRLYDVVLNVDKVTMNLAVETVVTMARSPEMKTCTMDSMQSLSKLSLYHRADAALVESGVSYGQATAVSISVDEPGKVTLTGLVEDERSKIRAEEVIRGVKGVESVDNQIRVRPADRHA